MVSSGVTGTSQADSSNKTGFNSTKKTDSSVDFESFMNNSISASAKNDTHFKNDIGNRNGNTNVKNERTENKEDAASQQNRKTDNVSESAKKVNDKLKESGESQLDSAAESKIKDALDDIKDQIKKTFNITEEDLAGFLQNLGITMQDLMNPANLTNLVVEITGTQDTLTLLTDSNLSQQFKSLMNYVDSQVQNLSKQLNVSTEDLKHYIENNLVQNEADGKNPVTVVSNTASEEMQTASHESKSEKNGGDSTLEKLLENRMTVESKSNTDAGSSGNKDLMGKNQNENDNGSVLNNAAQNLARKIDGAFSTVSVNSAQQIDTADIIRQIVDAVKVRTTQEISSMEIQLNPEHLGKVSLSVLAKDGMITAQIAVQDEVVKKAIENQLVVLKDNLNSQGIKIDAVEVTVASHQFEANQNFGNGSSEKDNQNKKSNSNMNGLTDLYDDVVDDNENHVKNLINENSSVEFTA